MSRSELVLSLRLELAELIKKCRATVSPHPGFFRAFGESHAVPQKFTRRSWEVMQIGTETEKERLMTLLQFYFCTHGMISCNTASSGNLMKPSLAICKKASQGEILYLFGARYGGSIIRHTRKHHLLVSPSCVWNLYGSPVYEASKELGAIPSPLQEKLLALSSLSSWPEFAPQRQAVWDEIARIPRNPRTPLKVDSLDAAVTLFDVSGSLFLHGARHDKLRLSISCPSRAEFDQLTQVWRDAIGASLTPNIRLHQGHTMGRVYCSWRLTHDRTVRQVLEVLRTKSILKRLEITLALGMQKENGWKNMEQWYTIRSPVLGASPRYNPEYHDKLRRLRVLDTMKRTHKCANIASEADDLISQLEVIRIQSKLDFVKSLLSIQSKKVEL